MSRKKRKHRNSAPSTSKQRTAADKRLLLSNILRLLVLIAVTLAVYIVYRVFVEMYFYPVMITYTVIAAASTIGYVVYNRGFSRRNVTLQMLPDTMSDEEKTEFIEDAKRRLVRSRPLFIVAFAFMFTFIMDVIEIIALPFFAQLFGL